LSADCGIDVREKKHKALCGKGLIDGSKVLLAKPQTYMNLSGESLRAMVDFYQIQPENVIVICDDINLPAGQLRIRERGSAGGHNGLKNIIQHLGTQDFMRIRIGVGGKPEGWDLADYVLARISGQDRKILDEAEADAAEAAKLMAAGQTVKAMNLYNIKKERV
jgi:PTH1 family peptidyl-tRNA hydrolase